MNLKKIWINCSPQVFLFCVSLQLCSVSHVIETALVVHDLCCTFFVTNTTALSITIQTAPSLIWSIKHTFTTQQIAYLGLVSLTPYTKSLLGSIVHLWLASKVFPYISFGRPYLQLNVESLKSRSVWTLGDGMLTQWHNVVPVRSGLDPPIHSDGFFIGFGGLDRGGGITRCIYW